MHSMGEFERGIGRWYERPQDHHTWQNFKLHFTKAYNTLRRLRGPTMRNTAYHQQAQYITREVLNVVQTNRNQIFEEVKATEDNILRALQLNNIKDLDALTKHTDPSTLTPEPVVNVTTTDTIQLKMLQILECIGKKLDTAPVQQPSKKKWTRKHTSKYCWSHGGCNHPGQSCKNPKQGHKEEGTFANKMGGSTFFCTPAE